MEGHGDQEGGEAMTSPLVVKVLAEAWCILNREEWPEWFEQKNDNQMWPIMCAITEMIGMKACLREWNNNMSDSEFEKLWRKMTP